MDEGFLDTMMNRMLSTSQEASHPALRLAKALLRWLDRDGLAPSHVLAQGWRLARSRDDDGASVERLRPLLQHDMPDVRWVQRVLDGWKDPRAARAQVLAEALEQVWVPKVASKKAMVRPDDRRAKPDRKSASPAHRTHRPATTATVTVKRVKRWAMV